MRHAVRNGLLRRWRLSAWSVLAPLTVLFAMSSLCRAQTVGIQPFGSYVNAFDNVNLADLGLHIDIPLYVHAARGSANGISVHLVYDSAFYDDFNAPGSRFITAGNGAIQGGQAYASNVGWRIVSQAAGGGAIYEDAEPQLCASNPNTPNTVASISFEDSTGYRHPFTSVYKYPLTCPDSGPPSANTPQYAWDGSGYYMTTDQSGGQVTITSPSGVRYTSSIPSANQPNSVKNPSGITTVLDTNGNTGASPGSFVAAEDPANVYSGGTQTITDSSGVSVTITNGGYPPTSNPPGLNLGPVQPFPDRAPTLIRYKDTNGNTQTITITYQILGIGNTVYTPAAVVTALVDSVQFPDGSGYHFTYQGNGLLGSVTFPTGGTITYSNQTTNNQCSATQPFVNLSTLASPLSLTRTTSDGTTVYQLSGNCASTLNTTTITRPDGSREIVGTETMLGHPADASFLPVEKSHQWVESSGTTIKSTVTCYNGASGNCASTPSVFPSNGASTPIITAISTVATGADPSRVVQHFDPVIGLPTEKDEYDVNGTTLLRKNVTMYGNLGNNISDHPSAVTVMDGNGNVASQTTYGYDEYSLTPTPTLAEHNAVANGTRGNLTSVHKWLNTSSSTVDTHFQYDDSGQLVASEDANANWTHYSYDTATNSCLNKVTMPTLTSGLVISTSRACDGTTGLPISSTDANNKTTTYGYDSMLHQTSTQFPDGGSTSVSYNSGSSVITSTVTASPNASQVETVHLDGYGRVSQTQMPNGATIDTQYDALGHLRSVSAPHLSTSGPTDGTTFYNYDALGRKTLQTQPDGATLKWSYSGSTVSFTDEASNTWSRTYDGLGRIGDVAEPNGAHTGYVFDALNNLVIATQIGLSGDTRRSRNFSYDSLSRLLSATNPETGTINYGYDANGNLLAKTDARGITVNYVYDALNRPTKSYTATDLAVQLYVYDTNQISFAQGQHYTTSNVTGRLSVICVDIPGACQSMTAYSYDAMGRVTQTLTSTPSNPSTGAVYSTSAQYDMAGNMTLLTYPDGRTVTQGWNNAGQLQSVTYDSWNGQHIGYPYISSTVYWPSGSLRALFYGNNMASGYHVNNRLETDETSHIQLTNNARYSEKLYCFGVATSPIDSVSPPCDAISSGNNGNVYQIKDIANPANMQSFTYDSLNRITGASVPSHSQQYGYDAFGNMSIISGGNFASSFDPTTNRISNLPCASVAAPYDASGNQLCDTDSNGGVRRYAWDAESRTSQITSLGTTAPFVAYLYDGNGQRTQKSNADGSFTEYLQFNGQTIAERNSDNSWSDYIFANGQRIARADTASNPLNPQASTTFYHFGRLGSTEVATDGNGNLLSSSDYLPFGQELTANASNNHYKFTGKERDTESGLDYFGARYYGSSMGRFMSPDPSGLLYADSSNPQSLNLYSYALNNPLRFIDPTGLTACFYGGKGDTPVINGQGNDHDPTDYEDVADEATCKANGGVSINANTFVQVTANANNDNIDVSSITLTNTFTYKQCSATQFKVTGVGPGQAPGNGAFTGQAPVNGQVAIKPQNFGIPYSNVAQRSAAQSGGVKAAISNTVIFPNYQTASVPKGVPQTPFGAPSGPYTPADAIGPSSVRDSPGNQIDVYRYDSQKNALNSTRTTTPTVFVPNNNSGVGCPN